ncbi:hypothetical protein [Priestia megaterium]|uniref:hypothetical protein n=1 Tax=Priestia megaterium TaxID=1404 RepID=UPI00300BEAA7
MDINLTKKELLSIDSYQFYQKYLLGNEVWYYKVHLEDSQYSNKYDSMKRFIASELGLHFNNIAIFGSAKIGFSLNPQKDFREFNAKSDIDLAIVSEELFHKFWKSYLEMHSNLRYIKKYSIVTSSLFRQFITLDGLDNLSPFFVEWTKKTSGFVKDLQLLFDFKEHDINYRIFYSWDAVQRYYVRNIDDLKKIEEKKEEKKYDQ